MRSVNVAELKNRLSKYLTFAKGGEEVVIRDRNLPVAKLVPFLAEGADEQELMLVAAGKLRLPSVQLDVKELWPCRPFPRLLLRGASKELLGEGYNSLHPYTPARISAYFRMRR